MSDTMGGFPLGARVLCGSSRVVYTVREHRRNSFGTLLLVLRGDEAWMYRVVPASDCRRVPAPTTLI